MRKRNYIILCEERCCECKGAGEREDKTACQDCGGKGFTQYPVNLKKALFELLLTGFMTGEADE